MLHSISVNDSNVSDGGPTIVLCHGFGADADDLAPLARAIPGLDGVRWIFPQAPHEFQMGWGTGRAWFPRDPSGIQAFMSGDDLGRLGDLDPPDLGNAVAGLNELLNVSGCDPARTVIGGFSQGAMVAAAAAIQSVVLPAGLLLLSGSIIAAERLSQLADQRRAEIAGLRVAQYHGREDPVLPFHSGELLAKLLATAGADVRFTPFAGGHEIPQSLFESVAREVRGMLSLR